MKHPVLEWPILDAALVEEGLRTWERDKNSGLVLGVRGQRVGSRHSVTPKACDRVEYGSVEDPEQGQSRELNGAR